MNILNLPTSIKHCTTISRKKGVVVATGLKDQKPVINFYKVTEKDSYTWLKTKQHSTKEQLFSEKSKHNKKSSGFLTRIKTEWKPINGKQVEISSARVYDAQGRIVERNKYIYNMDKNEKRAFQPFLRENWYPQNGDFFFNTYQRTKLPDGHKKRLNWHIRCRCWIDEKGCWHLSAPIYEHHNQFVGKKPTK